MDTKLPEDKENHSGTDTEDLDGFCLPKNRGWDMPYRMQGKEKKAGQKGLAEICNQCNSGGYHRSSQQFFGSM